jgi:hypothetical protein
MSYESRDVLRYIYFAEVISWGWEFQSLLSSNFICGYKSFRDFGAGVRLISSIFAHIQWHGRDGYNSSLNSFRHRAK